MVYRPYSPRIQYIDPGRVQTRRGAAAPERPRSFVGENYRLSTAGVDPDRVYRDTLERERNSGFGGFLASMGDEVVAPFLRGVNKSASEIQAANIRQDPAVQELFLNGSPKARFMTVAMDPEVQARLGQFLGNTLAERALETTNRSLRTGNLTNPDWLAQSTPEQREQEWMRVRQAPELKQLATLAGFMPGATAGVEAFERNYGALRAAGRKMLFEAKQRNAVLSITAATEADVAAEVETLAQLDVTGSENPELSSNHQAAVDASVERIHTAILRAYETVGGGEWLEGGPAAYVERLIQRLLGQQRDIQLQAKLVEESGDSSTARRLERRVGQISSQLGMYGLLLERHYPVALERSYGDEGYTLRDKLQETGTMLEIASYGATKSRAEDAVFEVGLRAAAGEDSTGLIQGVLDDYAAGKTTAPEAYKAIGLVHQQSDLRRQAAGLDRDGQKDEARLALIRAEINGQPLPQWAVEADPSTAYDLQQRRKVEAEQAEKEGAAERLAAWSTDVQPFITLERFKGPVQEALRRDAIWLRANEKKYERARGIQLNFQPVNDKGEDPVFEQYQALFQAQLTRLTKEAVLNGQVPTADIISRFVEQARNNAKAEMLGGRTKLEGTEQQKVRAYEQQQERQRIGLERLFQYTAVGVTFDADTFFKQAGLPTPPELKGKMISGRDSISTMGPRLDRVFEQNPEYTMFGIQRKSGENGREFLRRVRRELYRSESGRGASPVREAAAAGLTVNSKNAKAVGQALDQMQKQGLSPADAAEKGSLLQQLWERAANALRGKAYGAEDASKEQLPSGGGRKGYGAEEQLLASAPPQSTTETVVEGQGPQELPVEPYKPGTEQAAGPVVDEATGQVTEQATEQVTEQVTEQATGQVPPAMQPLLPPEDGEESPRSTIWRAAGLWALASASTAFSNGLQPDAENMLPEGSYDAVLPARRGQVDLDGPPLPQLRADAPAELPAIGRAEGSPHLYRMALSRARMANRRKGGDTPLTYMPPVTPMSPLSPDPDAKWGVIQGPKMEVTSFEALDGSTGGNGFDMWGGHKEFRAALPGVVVDADYQVAASGRGFGNFVTVRSTDPVTGRPVDVLYAHFGSAKGQGVNVKVGDRVSAGDVLGQQGSTGSVQSVDGTIASIDFYEPGKGQSGPSSWSGTFYGGTKALRERLANNYKQGRYENPQQPQQPQQQEWVAQSNIAMFRRRETGSSGFGNTGRVVGEAGAVLLTEFGFTKAAAAALAGNISQESGWAGSRTWDDVGQIAGGIVSWRGDRLRKIERYLGKQIADSTTFEQIRAMAWELQQRDPEAYRKLRTPGALTMEQIFAITKRYWGYGEPGERYTYAQDLLKVLR